MGGVGGGGVEPRERSSVGLGNSNERRRRWGAR